MAVVSIMIPARNEARLGVNALAHGVVAEKIDTDGGYVYVDLIGTAEKALQASLGTSAQVLDVTNFTQGAGLAGHVGDGIMIGAEHDRERRYSGLMKTAR